MSAGYRYLRQRMVRLHVAGRGITDPRVLDAMARVPRHRFVRDHLHGQAYGDHALPIGDGQTISQPWVVGRMLEALELEADHSVLEIGTGSGYQTALLALLVRRVYSLERVPSLAREAIARLRRLDLGGDNVKIQAFDGTVGWSEVAPFDRIVVAAGAPGAPQPLLDQLADGGLMLVPEGDMQRQHLVRYRRRGDRIERTVGEEVAFVPLVGRHGWSPARRGA